MNWYWKVRIYNTQGQYGVGWLKTGRDLREIDTIQDAYFTLTGCKMLLEGMSEEPMNSPLLTPIDNAFAIIWTSRP